MWLEEIWLEATHLIHDRDTKFMAVFSALLDSASDIDVVKSPVRPPNAKVSTESWIATVKRECLDYFAYFSLRHADHIVKAFVAFYSDHRPHQSLGNRTLDLADKPSLGSALTPAIVGKIGCRSELVDCSNITLDGCLNLSADFSSLQFKN